MRGEVSVDGGTPPLWRKENQLRKLAGRQPGETAAIAEATEGQAPVAVQTVPAQIGNRERFAAHGLHRIPEERLDLADLDGGSLQALTSLPGNGTESIATRWNARKPRRRARRVYVT